jgi:hypothetical protein
MCLHQWPDWSGTNNLRMYEVHCEDHITYFNFVTVEPGQKIGTLHETLIEVSNASHGPGRNSILTLLACLIASCALHISLSVIRIEGSHPRVGSSKRLPGIVLHWRWLNNRSDSSVQWMNNISSGLSRAQSKYGHQCSSGQRCTKPEAMITVLRSANMFRWLNLDSPIFLSSGFDNHSWSCCATLGRIAPISRLELWFRGQWWWLFTSRARMPNSLVDEHLPVAEQPKSYPLESETSHKLNRRHRTLILIIDEYQNIESNYLYWYQFPLIMIIQFVNFNSIQLQKRATIQQPEKAVSSCISLDQYLGHR